MKLLKPFIALLSSMFLAACGGGGGSAGSTPFGGGSGSGSGGSGSSAAASITVQVTRSGTSTTQISSTETVQAVAIVRNSSGAAMEGVVVSFSEDGTSLLKIAPSSGTALTDSSGVATVDITAATASNTGAAAVKATASVGSESVSGSRAIQITAGSGGGGTAAPPAAVNFIGAVPASTAIVVKGAGGSGRSESAILTFRVVDSTNAPVNATGVAFTINSNSGGATITPASAVTNASGEATVTVSSGTQPASVIVTATSTVNASIKTQSDTLIVSNDVVLPAGFEIVAEKYNLDGRLTGDKTKITAYVRDQFGNPVADGVAVNFTTDYGVVASSTLGGCTTVNGTCSVDFKVQNPRGAGIATVIGSVRIGDTQVVSGSLQINMAGATGTPYLALDDVGNTVTQVALNGTCKKIVELYLSDGSGRSTAAGTTISAPTASSGATVTVKTGSPVLDQVGGGFPPTLFSVEIDLSGTSLSPACNAAAGAGTPTAADPTFFRLEFKTPNSLLFSQRVEVLYPH